MTAYSATAGKTQQGFDDGSASAGGRYPALLKTPNGRKILMRLVYDLTANGAEG